MGEFTPEWAADIQARARAGWGRGTPTPDRREAPGDVPLIRADRYRNKWEREYGQQLGMLRHIGEIVDFRYEGIAFRLADGTHLHPDFLVITPRGFEIHEVKGQRREKWWSRFKIAAEMFPWFRWFVCVRKGGTWELKEVGR